MRNLWALRLFAVVLVVSLAPQGLAAADEAPLETTKTAAHKFDLDREVVAFVSNLIENNSTVRRQRRTMQAQERRAVNNKSWGAPEELHAIRWLVPMYNREYRSDRGQEEGEFVYLVQEPLYEAMHHGYVISGSIVSRVTVNLHEEYEPQPGAEGSTDFKLVKSVLGMKWDGLVDVLTLPVRPVNLQEADLERLNARYTAADKELNDAYRKLSAVLKKDEKEQLVREQRAWIRERDEATAGEFEDHGEMGRLKCLLAYTEQRAKLMSVQLIEVEDSR